MVTLMHISNFMTVCWEGRTKQPFFLFLLCILSLGACRDKEESVAADFVSQRSPFETGFHDTTTLIAYTTLHDSIRTRALTYYMLGSLNDPEIGTTDANIYTQYALPYADFSFGSGAVIDSVVLQLPYATTSSYYGELNSNQALRVYELNEDLSASEDSLYFSNRIYQYSAVQLGEYTGSFTSIDDSVTIQLGSQTTKVEPHVRIRLDALSNTLKDRFANPPSGSFAGDSAFKAAFKGLAVVSAGSPAPGSGCLSYINLRTSAAAVVVYYNDSLKAEFPIYKINGIRTNQFKHTYLPGISIQPAFSGVHSDVNYLQPATGLKTRITFPYLFDYVKHHKIALTGAELIFTVKSGTSNGVFSLPSAIKLRSSDSLGRNQLILDEVISPTYYGGTLESGQTYRFNVVREMQQIINQYQNSGLNINYGLNLFVQADYPVTGQRVVLDTRRGTGTFKLNLSYTVIK